LILATVIKNDTLVNGLNAIIAIMLIVVITLAVKIVLTNKK